MSEIRTCPLMFRLLFSLFNTSYLSFSGALLIGRSPGEWVVPYMVGATTIVDSWVELKEGK